MKQNNHFHQDVLFYPTSVQRTWIWVVKRLQAKLCFPNFRCFFSQDHLEGTWLEIMIINLFFVMFKIWATKKKHMVGWVRSRGWILPSYMFFFVYFVARNLDFCQVNKPRWYFRIELLCQNSKGWLLCSQEGEPKIGKPARLYQGFFRGILRQWK